LNEAVMLQYLSLFSTYIIVVVDDDDRL